MVLVIRRRSGVGTGGCVAGAQQGLRDRATRPRFRVDGVASGTPLKTDRVEAFHLGGTTRWPFLRSTYRAGAWLSRQARLSASHGTSGMDGRHLVNLAALSTGSLAHGNDMHTPPTHPSKDATYPR